MTPEVLTHNRGVCLKFKEGLHTKRKVFMSDGFKADHAVVVQVLEAMKCKTLMILETIEDFASHTDVAARHKKPFSVVALIADHERHIFVNAQQCFTMAEDLGFLVPSLASRGPARGFEATIFLLLWTCHTCCGDG